MGWSNFSCSWLIRLCLHQVSGEPGFCLLTHVHVHVHVHAHAHVHMNVV